MQLSLKDAREKKGLPVSELARRSGVHKSTVFRLERGANRPGHDTVRQLEEALGLQPGTLVFEATK